MTRKPTAPAPPKWSAAIAASAAREAEERAAAAPLDPDVQGWDHVRAEARRMFPNEADPHYRFLLWLNHRRTLAGMHALDPLWLDGFRAFYASGKPVMVARKGLRAGGSVSACCALTADALDQPRDVDPGTILVFPIMSSSRDEATDRFVTIKKNLHACGIAPKKKKGEDEGDAEDVLPNGIGGEYESKRSLSGGGIIALQDSQGHAIEIRILPAMRRAAVGYTGGGGFLDETDLWPDDSELHVNPADVVITDVLKRITTQPTARIYIFSASYYAESAHSRRVDMGDTSAQFVLRLGEEGARRDEESRRALAAMIGGTPDPRLLEPADPRSPDLPAWAFNPSASPIARCYQLSDDKLGQMLGLYGGRASENAGAQSDSLAAAKVSTAPLPARSSLSDVVIGVAPPTETAPEWSIIIVGIGAGGFVIIGDATHTGTSANTAGMLATLGKGHAASVLAVAKEHEDRLNAEIAAGVAGIGAYVPPVYAADIYDGRNLRTGPLRSLLDAERLCVATGLTGLVRAIGSHRPGARSARIEALAAAVARLVACYPWAATSQNGAPLVGPKAVQSILAGDGAVDMLERLGAKDARAWTR